MKRCPECRRDYLDDSLLYCLEDGTALVQGSVPSPDEPQTALFHDKRSAETAILAHSEAVPPAASTTVPDCRANVVPRPWARIFIVSAALLFVVALGGFAGYRYFTRANSIGSVAVMPFINDTGSPDLEYLSDGMTETLIRSLSQLPNLNVKARSSVFRYKGKDVDPKTIASDLNVQAILNGSLRQRGDQMVLDLELFDPVTGNVIWTNEYDRPRSELVTLQSEIALDVLGQLRTRLSGADKVVAGKAITPNSAAYQAYLRGRYHWNRRTPDDLQKAIEQFTAATAADPKFALAYTGLADTYAVMPYYVGCRSATMMQQAKPFAERAVELDDQLAEAHTALAFVNEGTWNFAEAEREYKRALEIDPNYTTALYRYARFLVRARNRPDEAIEKIERTLALEPAHLVANGNLSEIYLSQGKTDSALEQARRTTVLDPGFLFGWADLAYAQARSGKMSDALDAATQAATVGNGSSRSRMVLGFVYGLAAKRAEALSIVRTLEADYQRQRSDAVEVAAVYSGLGDKDKAFEWLNRGFEDHSSILVDIRAEYQFAPLSDDERFKELLKRIGMPE